jgi:hypothetical protein
MGMMISDRRTTGGCATRITPRLPGGPELRVAQPIGKISRRRIWVRRYGLIWTHVGLRRRRARGCLDASFVVGLLSRCQIQFVCLINTVLLLTQSASPRLLTNAFFSKPSVPRFDEHSCIRLLSSWQVNGVFRTSGLVLSRPALLMRSLCLFQTLIRFLAGWASPVELFVFITHNFFFFFTSYQRILL